MEEKNVVERAAYHTIESASEFQNILRNHKGKFVVDFWAPWCGPCLALAPIFESVASELKDQISFAKVNVDDNPALAKQYNITSIPTIIIIENGEILKRHSGFIGRNDFKNLIK